MGAVGDSFCYLPVRLSSKTANRHFSERLYKVKISHWILPYKVKSERGKQISHINTYMWNPKKKKNGIGDLIHTAVMDRDRCENKQIPRGKEGGVR